uniref:Uncharacterized protein n=1 Tax=Arundo donax TaxID=35708 RepID=A0A0A9GIC4_ARUDO
MATESSIISCSAPSPKACHFYPPVVNNVDGKLKMN